MPEVARVGDKSDDADGFDPSPAEEGAETVFCNGKAVVLLGSKFADQVRKEDQPVMDEETGEQKVDDEGNPVFKKVVVETKEDIKVTSASSTVFVEGIPIARKGDSLSHGSIAEGSDNVFAN